MPDIEIQTEKPRPVYTDGWNSYWHLLLGIMSAKFPLIIVPLYLSYQLFDIEERNVCIDILEFLIGMVTGMCLRVFHLI